MKDVEGDKITQLRAYKQRPRKLTRFALRSMRVGERYWSNSWAGIPTSDHKTELEKFLKNLSEEAVMGRGLFLTGKYQTGKTALSCFILKRAYQLGLHGMFTRETELPDFFWSSEGEMEIDGNSLRERIYGSHILVIDDFGNRSPNDKIADLVEKILRYRNERMFSTIITSTCSPRDISSRYSRGIVNMINRTMKAVSIEGHVWQE